MANGSNNWDVKWSRISFFDGILSSHGNVRGHDRDQDILFTVDLKSRSDQIRVLCVDEYVCGIAAVRRAITEFGPLQMIFIGGTWNGYTKEAKDYCLQEKIGLYNASEIAGGLWKDAYWDYVKKDDDGNPVYLYRSA